MARILVAEDNPKNLRLMQMLLKSQGHEVLTAEDGETALSVAQRETPDLIIMDMQLPKLDGFEATRRIKADPALAATPVLGVSAYAMQSDRERGMAAGCDGYVTKPINTRSFGDTVASMLGADPASAGDDG